MQQSLVIIKPDAVDRGLVGQIIARFEKAGLKLVAAKMVQLDDASLNEHYQHHADKPFFQDLKDFMRSAPVLVMCWQGDDAVDVIRKLCGATDPAKAQPGTIRRDFGGSVQKNLVHASDSVDTADREIARFFEKGEIVSSV